ncbi:hypothetical protein C3477_23865 [Mycobacterium kansasii]|uniref:hypothetical protein n=1 Tax=Mycobacterium kansasii TaxID=1768 RepID=UPI000CDDDA96|nr:hypothetical protein [Mycobacterium kansasii]POX82193.1 hypothetical protein C3B43_25830 [Mycobacterium kansasii]POX98435.1 hypothetical protein C3477_23865 [Mycobacterium kansasii]POY20187.1 hypothetical protein C3476_15920 [Mycobacterium kansasii]
MVVKLAGVLVSALLVMAALVFVFWGIVTAATLYGMYLGGRRSLRWYRARTALAAHRRAELLARAEIQHRWYLAGDPRGTYGRYTPACYRSA